MDHPFLVYFSGSGSFFLPIYIYIYIWITLPSFISQGVEVSSYPYIYIWITLSSFISQGVEVSSYPAVADALAALVEWVTTPAYVAISPANILMVKINKDKYIYMYIFVYIQPLFHLQHI